MQIIHMKGVQVMVTVNLQCNKFKCFLQAENSITGRAYVHGRSADKSLAKIH